MRKILITIFLISAIALMGVIFTTQNFTEVADKLTENRKTKEKIEKTEVEINKKEIETEEDESEPEVPQETKEEDKKKRRVSYQWHYNNQEYELNAVLHESTYNYYGSQPKEYTYTGTRPANWKEEYYNMFLQTAEGDNTFSELASKLEEVGEMSNLTNDKTVELTVSFVQSIPYDEEKSLSENFRASYPYEVLYEKKGVCSGKSFLGALLVKELGYGVALFSFEDANHMVIGIKCPEQYDSYNSGYCYTELTTPGWKIGIEDFQDIENITSSNQVPSLTSQPTIHKIADGKTYYGIAETIQEKQRIKTLNREIDELEIKIKELEEDLNHYEETEDYESYNELVPVYNDLIELYQEKVTTYNNLISQFSPGN